MQILLRKFDPSKCCLCGSANKLTGEHKLKASALRNEFGNVKLFIGNPSEENTPMKLAQSPKSKKFHFKARLCQRCNSVDSQIPDRAFDKFHALANSSITCADKNYWSNGLFMPPEFEHGSENLNNLFRYFSKILCCRLAESSGPTPIYLAKHAIGEFQQNRVGLQVRKDPTQEQYNKEYGDWPYAAHGGLVVYCNKQNGTPNAFHSAVSFGPVQYIFWFQLHWLEKLELKIFHRKFYSDLSEIGRMALDCPISESEQRKIGLL